MRSAHERSAGTGYYDRLTGDELEELIHEIDVSLQQPDGLFPEGEREMNDTKAWLNQKLRSLRQAEEPGGIYE